MIRKIGTAILFVLVFVVSLLIAYAAGWLCTLALALGVKILFGMDISAKGGYIITFVIAILMAVSFWGRLLLSKKERK